MGSGAMADWDDIRFFLGVAETGSIKAAGARLKVNPTTVFRRVKAYEQRLGFALFDRLKTGYVLTPEGDRMLAAARAVADRVAQLDRLTTAADDRLAGPVRVATHEIFVTRFLAPPLRVFAERHPEVSLELMVSPELANLSRREADVAIRVTNAPADSLFGRRVLTMAIAQYASRDYLARHSLDGAAPSARWIGWVDDVPKPRYITQSAFGHLPVHHRVNGYTLWLEMARAGMGIVELPCFLGDAEPDLTRVPGAQVKPAADVWVLSHQDVRHTPRFRMFREFIAEAFLSERALFEGEMSEEELAEAP